MQPQKYCEKWFKLKAVTKIDITWREGIAEGRDFFVGAICIGEREKILSTAVELLLRTRKRRNNLANCRPPDPPTPERGT